MTTDDPLIAAFFEEAGELLADFEAGLLGLEARPGDVELLNAIFRGAHTLKGNSAMLGFEAIAHVTHGLEDLLDQLRKGRRPVSARVTDVLLRAADILRALLARARTGAEWSPDERAAADELTASVAALNMGAPDGPPSPPRSGPGMNPDPPRVPEPVTPSSTASSMFKDASIRIPLEKVDRLVDLVGELVITQSMVADAVAGFTPERLASLRAAVAQMDRHARELHERVMGVRMMPIRTLFGRFPRLVRDVAASVGKSVVLETSGEETELDRTVIELIGDPLAHLIRNAVDHGLERPDERRALGKPDVGRLTLGAFQQGGNIYIELTDDGRGLDRERIVAKARAVGLAGDDPLADEQVFAMIFRPGFSTAETVTELSGRGVGMDVVRRNVEALGGSIVIRSARGRGTSFRIKLPLTLAILDGQLLAVGAQTYVLPLASIVESVRPQRAQVSVIFGGGEAFTLRDRVLPMVRLHRLLGVRPRSEDPTEGLLVIVEQDGRQAAVLVDELLAQQQVVIKSLERHFDKVRGVAGATILGDGRVTLILDVPGVIALAGMRETVAA